MASIQDVARIAGVSVATVSRVLNNHPYVKKEKVEAVERAIAETGYIQNINAINLKKGKTNLVGVVLPIVDHPYFSQLIQGISQAAADQHRSEEHTSELQSRENLVCRLLLEKKNQETC